MRKITKNIVSHKSSKWGGIYASDYSVFNAYIKFTITVGSGYNEPVYTEHSLYRTIYHRTDFLIIN